MMNAIAGIPYAEARFDKRGLLENAIALPARATDLFVISHGWNSNALEAETLYRGLFENFAAVAQPNDLPGRTFAIVGVVWPSKQFDEASSTPGDLASKLDRMKQTFTTPIDHAALEQARSLLPVLDDKASARRAFANCIRSLLDPAAANREDASDTFFQDDGDELMKNLKEHFPGFQSAAMHFLNFTTYYEMKARAGAVGKHGLAKLLDGLAPEVERIHLIGHSFGGRLVTAAAAYSDTAKIRTMALLQAAFSHNAFSKTQGGFFRGVVDRRRVTGPILVTHTPNDKAVGIAYPIASRINGDKTAAFGGAHDKFGGLGRNGVQQMQSGEAIEGTLLPEGARYRFQPGTFFNLEASACIAAHADVTGKEVAYALRKVIAR